MYVGVDVGGTKTLVAVFSNAGKIVESRKFPTPQNYRHFLLELRHCLVHLEHQDFVAGGLGMPVTTFNRSVDRAVNFSNLPWHNVPIHVDVERIFHCPFVVDNDAKLASLSEAMALKSKYKRVLYITISTGIGFALTVDGAIDENIGDGGGRTILLEHEGKFKAWESFASGRAIVERYGKRAEDIHDQATWQKIARELRMGFLELIAITQPDVIVVGGSVGNYFERLQTLLEAELKQYETPLLPIPALKKAARPEEAVVYGCFALAKLHFAKKSGKRHAGVA